MSNNIFATDIKAVLQDSTVVTNAIGYVIDNKRVYKLPDGTVLTGSKKIKTMQFVRFAVPPEVLIYIMDKEYK
tara:strand:- start:1341 stop:1559 length:219 start_codon:yes stop_codon:yes gene_type:complete